MERYPEEMKLKKREEGRKKEEKKLKTFSETTFPNFILISFQLQEQLNMEKIKQKAGEKNHSFSSSMSKK